MDATLTFEDNGSYHEDLLLRVGDTVWRADSYYLLLDRGMLEHQEDSSKVRAVLRTLPGEL